MPRPSPHPRSTHPLRPLLPRVLGRLSSALVFLLLMPLTGALPEPAIPLDQEGTVFLQPGSAPSFFSLGQAEEPSPADHEKPPSNAGLLGIPRRTGLLQEDPLHAFRTGWAQLKEPSPVALRALYQDLFRNLGFHIPAVGADAINESALLSTTHPLGDVNGDGKDDILFDTYCVDWDLCVPPPGLEWIYCPVPKHWLSLRAGGDGESLWKKELDLQPLPLPTCRIDVVVGTVPNGAGYRDILTYRIDLVWAYTAAVFHHTVFLLDGKDGTEKWTYEAYGAAESDPYGVHMVAHTYLLLPHLQVPDDRGVRMVSPAVQPHLWVRGQGFANLIITDNGRFGVGDVIWDHQPIEWAAGIDLATGHESWHIDTFLPQVDRSVWPQSYPTLVNHFYGVGLGCCWDLNGDHVSDVIFTTVEWSPDRVVHAVGPEGWASRTVAFDGQDGHILYDVETEASTDATTYGSFLEPLGDVNGDGASDYYLVQAYVNLSPEWVPVDWRLVMSVVRGQDGGKLWSNTGKDLLYPLVLGDATGDGGNDILFSTFDTGRRIADGIVNVTGIHQALHRGSDGLLLWNQTTLAAPRDVFVMYENLKLNGVWDLDGDGVADVWRDALVQLADLTVLHNLTFVSGRTGEPLFHSSTVGAYAFPIGSGDLDGDGGNDFTITQGDLADIWVTAYNGHGGTPLWSRRILAIDVSSVYSSVPVLQYHTLELDGNMTEKDPFFSFTMNVVTYGGARNVGPTTYQQHQAIQGPVGQLMWAVPEIPEADLSLLLGEPTSATALYTGWQKPALTHVDEDGFKFPMPAAMGMVSAAFLTFGVMAARKRRLL